MHLPQTESSSRFHLLGSDPTITSMLYSDIVPLIYVQFRSVQFSRSVMSDSVRPHRRQPTRLPRPWDSLGKSTGVGCHFLLQCLKVKSESEGAQSCLTLCNPMDCSPPGSSVHEIFQAKDTGVGCHFLLQGIFPTQD